MGGSVRGFNAPKCLIAVLLLSLTVLSGTACGATEGERLDASEPAATEDAPDYSSPDTISADDGPAALGGWWQLETLDTAVRVWVTDYQRGGIKHDPDYEGPENERYDAVYVKVKNVGDEAYTDWITMCVVATNTDGNDFKATDWVQKKPSIGEVTIPPGETRAGWVVLDVGGTLETVMFTADGGFSQYGQWLLR